MPDELYTLGDCRAEGVTVVRAGFTLADVLRAIRKLYDHSEEYGGIHDEELAPFASLLKEKPDAQG